MTGRKAVKNAAYSLGVFGTLINTITIVWLVFALVIFCMPTSIPVDASTMNYASVVFAGFTTVSAAWYFIRGRNSFTGPPVVVSEGSDTDEHEAIGVDKKYGDKPDVENPASTKKD